VRLIAPFMEQYNKRGIKAYLLSEPSGDKFLEDLLKDRARKPLSVSGSSLIRDCNGFTRYKQRL